MYRFVSVPALTLAIVLSFAAGARANDRYTSLPVAPGVTDTTPVKSGAVCGSNHIRMSTFFWTNATAAPSIARWYQSALPDAVPSTRHPNANVTEYVVTTPVSRVVVFNLLGKTNMQIAHADRPVDFAHLPKNCSDTE